MTESLHPKLQQLLGQSLAERYAVDSLIGSGGMAAVFRGVDSAQAKPIAIKVLHPDLAVDMQASRRFDREARSTSRLDHPNCARVLDFGITDDGLKFLVMPLVEGTELGAWLGEAMAIEHAVYVMEQIFSALSHAHEQGVVHRDLKPENILVSRDENERAIIQLLDFGIARIVRGGISSDNITVGGMIIGTPEYMSPEQAVASDPDARTDLYSAGIIFYELLAGHRPFDHAEPHMLLQQHLLAPPPPLPQHIPPALATIVMRLLAKERDDRYSSAKEVLGALEALGYT